jgi:RNA 3'-terminal phosphate cyclase (ATP)
VIQIDGSTKSGSGTLVRFAAALCSLLGEPLHMFRIRAKREKPGLRHQHLSALRACCFLSSGRLEGDEPDSEEVFYYPGNAIRGGDFAWDIGTAGSATMMAFTLVPLALYASADSRFTITGGLFQDFAPTALHMGSVLFPLLRPMGAEVGLEIVRPGYVPQGQGRLTVSAARLKGPLKPFDRRQPGRITGIRGAAIASHLAGARVGSRMDGQCVSLLEPLGYSPRIEVTEDSTAVQRGAALLLWAETDTGCRIGADRSGKRGRRSESIADFVVKALIEDVESGATVDRFTADQLILFAALAGGQSRYVIPRATDHIASNLWLAEEILGARTNLEGNLLTIEGAGFFKE